MSASDRVDVDKPPARPVDVGERARLAARRRDRVLSIASPLGLLLAWELAAQTGLIDVRFFPAPSAIIGKLIEMAGSGELTENVLISLQRIVLGFLMGGVRAREGQKASLCDGSLRAGFRSSGPLRRL